jgi:hypothetical protein
MNKKYTLLNECLKALSEGVIKLLIEKGEAGLGKTIFTIKVLDNMGIDYVYINTYATPLAFYKLLYKNRNKKIIIFDDMKGISDPLIKSMLKSACGELPGGKRKVNYHSTTSLLEKEGLPSSFEIKAGINLIFNEDLVDFEPIVSRGVVIDFNFSFKEKIELFKEKIEEFKIDKEVLEYVEKYCNESTENVSIRTLVMLSRLKAKKYDFKNIAVEIFKSDERILDLIELSEKDWCKKYEKNRATFYRLKKKHNIDREGGKDK